MLLKMLVIKHDIVHIFEIDFQILELFGVHKKTIGLLILNIEKIVAEKP